MEKKYILALDQGTTSSKTLLIGRQGQLIDIQQKEFSQIYPEPGWVEHDPEEIWYSQWATVNKVLENNNISLQEIAAIGITNQRETTIVWDKNTGKAVCNAIVWQDKRTAPKCEQLKADGWEEYIKKNTGLVIDSYFSGTKLAWILDNIPGCREKAENKQLIFGTVDTWLVWKLSMGKSHVTDQTNASRTMLFNIDRVDWDPKLIKALDIPFSMLPAVLPSSANFGTCTIEGSEIPITGIAGDQQAALFGQACIEPGMAKNTYGTGCFMLMHTGDERKISKNGLLTTMACNWDNKPQYALEGSVFIAGAAIQWLRDGLKLFATVSDSEHMAEQVKDNHEVVVVPAFAGLGAPYWDMYARGAIFGLTRDTNANHLAKATLESLAFQTRDVLEAMENDAGVKLQMLKVDGGAVMNNYLMQFQADILQSGVERPENTETTAMGAAYLAGLKLNWWEIEEIAGKRKIDKVYMPEFKSDLADKLYNNWKKAITRTMSWLK